MVKLRKWRGFACRIRICEKEQVKHPEKAANLLRFGRGRRDIPDEEGTESSNIHAPRRSSCKPYEHRSRTGIRLASVFEPESSIAAGE